MMWGNKNIIKLGGEATSVVLLILLWPNINFFAFCTCILHCWVYFESIILHTICTVWSPNLKHKNDNLRVILFFIQTNLNFSYTNADNLSS